MPDHRRQITYLNLADVFPSHMMCWCYVILVRILQCIQKGKNVCNTLGYLLNVAFIWFSIYVSGSIVSTPLQITCIKLYILQCLLRFMLIYSIYYWCHSKIYMFRSSWKRIGLFLILDGRAWMDGKRCSGPSLKDNAAVTDESWANSKYKPLTVAAAGCRSVCTRCAHQDRYPHEGQALWVR